MVPLALFSAVLVGEGSLLLQCAEVLLNAGHEIRAIISSEPLIQNWATVRGIRHAPHDDRLFEFLEQTPFDYLFSIVNLIMLSAALLALPRRGAINFHDALLPRFAGLHATSWALIKQQQLHGVTWHEMTENVDAGRIVKQRSIDISPDETALSLNAKCYEAGAETFGELVGELASGTVSAVEPDHAERSYFGKYERPAAACLIAWDRSAEEIAALVAGLNFGPYENPLGLAKLVVGDDVVLATEVQVVGSATSGTSPGTVVAISDDAVRVATATSDLALRTLVTVDGQLLTISAFASKHGLYPGYRLTTVDGEAADRLTAIDRMLARYERQWVDRLVGMEPIELPYANRSSAPAALPQFEKAVSRTEAELAELARQLGGVGSEADLLTAALATYFARLGEKSTLTLGFSESELRRELVGLEGFFAAQVPLHLTLDPEVGVHETLRSILTEVDLVRRHRTYSRDVLARFPALGRLRASGGQPVFRISIEVADDLDGFEPAPGSELTVLVSSDGSTTGWAYNPSVLSARDIAAMQQQFGQLLRGAVNRNTPLSQVSLLTDEERARVLVEWNATATAYPTQACIHHLFEAQADRTPDAVAVACGDQQITYRELDARANRLARYLQVLGVGPESLVGLCMDRSVDLVVALLGTHKAGAAYVPLDPTYPVDRLSFMAEDSRLSVLLTQELLAQHVPGHQASVVRVDSDWGEIARQSAERPSSDVSSENLAYVIYTSGSTGKPKGVMVRHRNAVNFFVGMDERLDSDPGVWLAVTSLSFDISVLELLWTLTRGFKVVLFSEQKNVTDRTPLHRVPAGRDVAFSLSYFASDEGENVVDKYELLMEGAKFADRNGFEAVWTPERHFHAFGGLYPNPSVASAAIAAVTERVKIRAGSVVLPLHSPIRVAEEWSLVDNLSKGRVGISFAAGWQPNDFAIAPDRFADRKNVMVQEIDTVRRLWRGEAVRFPGPQGTDVGVRTLPRPVQPELPVWITAAGSPETFRLAGESGAGLLTHLLGQSVEELAEKLAIYRQSWRESGHPGTGHVTLMLHTFVGDDDEAVRETVRAPMKEYLRSSVDLIRKAAWSFPAFANNLQSTGQRPDEIFDSGGLTDEEMDALLDHAFERYFRTSGLFGTPERCLTMVDKLRSIEVDEIACLIDFGIPSATALQHLEKLNELKELSRSDAGEPADDSIAALIDRHGVTHLQCTPSMATMFLMDDRTRAALTPLKNMMIGGEAFPPTLAKQLTELVSGTVINMYGPTETTIWSSTYRLDGESASIPIGTPIANTQLYILDRHLQPTPIDVPGELFIGGDGVVRGYLNRPELTAERFVPDPFSDRTDARIYRTGDLARYRPDGNVEFLGRIDHQVKIRGYRIELGEIEALLREESGVKETVVVAREDVPGDVRLVAYVVPQGAAQIAVGDLREALKHRLPEFMVPSHVVFMDTFPLTPNAKIDRKALPAPAQVEPQERPAFVEPASDLETTIAGVWRSALNVSQVGVDDNFFDLGGHSLLMVQVQQTLRKTLQRSLSITDLFRFPTIRSLATHLSRDTDDTTTVQQGVERAGARRDMRELMMQRRQMRQRAAR